jgi:hypothetical protein
MRGAILAVLLATIGCKRERPGEPTAPPAAASTTASATAAPSAEPSASPPAASASGPTVVIGPRDAAHKIEELAVSGQNFACARYANGTVACAGQNNFSQLGRGTRAPITADLSPYELPAPVASIEGAKKLVASGASACVIGKDDRVYCWGNLAGKDTGAFDVVSTPTAVPKLTNVVDLAMSGMTYCAIRRDRTVACWGDNSAGQLGDGTTESRSEAVTVKGVAGAKQLAVTQLAACAIIGGGRVICWGAYGGTKGAPELIQKLAGVDEITAGLAVLCSRSGTEVQCGGGTIGAPTALKELAGATRIGGAGGTMCALRANGSVTCVDYFAGRKITEHEVDGRLLAVAGGGCFCAVTKSEAVRCEGDLYPRKIFERL